MMWTNDPCDDKERITYAIGLHIKKSEWNTVRGEIWLPELLMAGAGYVNEGDAFL